MKIFLTKLSLAAMLAVCAVWFVACGNSECNHKYDQWTVERVVTCTSNGLQTRTCEKCGYTDSQTTKALGHVEVTDAAIAATCTENGKTEGKHCSICGNVIVAQTVIVAHGHEEIVTEAIEATCQTTGMTEGRRCSICGTTTLVQSTIAMTDHDYSDGIILEPATCISGGQIQYTCSMCGRQHIDPYYLETISATELYTQSVEYVGEIITYDKSGAPLARGTGFVIESDGTIVTNYHVIEGACSADITLNGNTYNIVAVLAYDPHIDLAVIKIKASGLTTATVCKNPVKVGETVYTLGSSRGLTNTYAQGIITYADRVIDGVVYVQHDAAMSSGNSGGPLINSFGEVIGINTFLLRDAQNLNFSVFASELDNLNYGTPMTLQDVYNKESNKFEALKNAVIANGVYDSYEGYYLVSLGDVTDTPYTYYREIYYYPTGDFITIDLLIVEDRAVTDWLYIEIDSELSGEYFWKYINAQDHVLIGTLTASTHQSSTILKCTDYRNMTYQEEYDIALDLASRMVNYLCNFITEDFSAVGVTAADLGFVNYP